MGKGKRKEGSRGYTPSIANTINCIMDYFSLAPVLQCAWITFLWAVSEMMAKT